MKSVSVPLKISLPFISPVFHADGKVLGGREAAANMVQRSRIPTHGISPFTNRTAFVSFFPFPLLPEFSSFCRFSFLETYSTSFLFLSWKIQQGEILRSENIAKNNRGNIRSKVFLFLATVEQIIVWFQEKIFSFFSVILERKKNDKKKMKGGRGRGW